MNILLVGNTELKNFLKTDKVNIFTSSFSEQSDFPIEKNKFSLYDVCKDNNIDVILQVESLGTREIIIDLDRLECLKIYYAIDIHLNYYWQKEYGKCFDIFLTSQKNFIKKSQFDTLCKTFWVPWGVSPNFTPNFKPFSKREFDITFIGLIDKNRIKRKNIIDIVKNKYKVFIAGDTLENRISFEKLISIYNNSKIVINESINREVNFRYFEATFSGALLFTEKIQNGETELFKEDEEFVTYTQENITEKIEFLITNQDKAEEIAFKGFLKTKKYHTLKNRAEHILQIINTVKFNIKKKPNIATSLAKTIFYISLRGIGKPVYINKIINRFLSSYDNVDTILIKFSLIKAIDKREALSFIIERFLHYNDDIIVANIVSLMIELNEIEGIKRILNTNDIFQGILKLIQRMIKIKKDYLQGFINASNKIKIILSAFDLVLLLFDNFKNKAVSSKKLNLIGAKILMDNNNYQGAIYYLLNNVRNFPDDSLTRKYLSECYYEIYSLELYILEKLKLFLLERDFNKFKEWRKANFKQKKEAILDIITHTHEKKLARDIAIHLSEYF